MVKKAFIYLVSAAIFGAIGSMAHGNDYEVTHPPLALAAFSGVSTETPKGCDCVHGEKCTCGPDCTCAEGIGCGKRAAARRAARQQADSGMEEVGSYVGFEPQAIVVQQAQPVQVATSAPADSKCPCCGMDMTAEQMKTMKARMGAPAAPVQAAPVPYTAAAPVGSYRTSYASVPSYASYGSSLMGGNCSGGNCAGGNCGNGRVGIFRRR